MRNPNKRHREPNVLKLYKLSEMINDEVYDLILRHTMASHQRPRRVILKNMKPRKRPNSASPVLMQVMCDLVNRRIELQEDDQKKTIPIFRQVKLRDIGSDEMDLEVILEEKAALLVKR